MKVWRISGITDELVDAVGAATQDEAEIDKLYMAEPLTDGHCLKNYTSQRGEERQRNEVI